LLHAVCKEEFERTVCIANPTSIPAQKKSR
jgi:hypothetical protein